MVGLMLRPMEGALRILSFYYWFGRATMIKFVPVLTESK